MKPFSELGPGLRRGDDDTGPNLVPPADEFFLDPRAVRRSFDAASDSFDKAAGIHAEIRDRLLERLDVVRIKPQVVIDLGAATGHASRALKQRYNSAQVIAADFSTRMLQLAAKQQRLLRHFARVAADARALCFRDASIDLVFSNLMLQWCNQPDAVFAEVRRVLRPQGLLTFTTLGPDTLRELRLAWQGADVHTHVNRFIDMHDIGDALMRAGFSEPVMDTERLTVTYPTTDALLRELKLSGAGNVNAGRAAGLTSPRRLQRVRDGYASRAGEGAIAVTLEVVYGHAWAGEQRRPRHPQGEQTVSLDSLRRRATIVK
jgi:malonyl-CoA O-methyltransferase